MSAYSQTLAMSIEHLSSWALAQLSSPALSAKALSCDPSDSECGSSACATCNRNGLFMNNINAQTTYKSTRIQLISRCNQYVRENSSQHSRALRRAQDAIHRREVGHQPDSKRVVQTDTVVTHTNNTFSNAHTNHI